MAETANVEILINAFTETAEDAIDEVGDRLDMLAVSSRPAQSGLDEVADEMDDVSTSSAVAGERMDEARDDSLGLAAALQALQGRADEAGDEMTQAAGKASIMGGVFSAVTVGTNGLSVTLGTLSTVMLLSIIPAVVALLSTLFPLVAVLGAVAAAVGGLAAAFGAIAIPPLVTGMDALKSSLSLAKREIEAIIEPLGQRFLPLLLEAIHALPDLVENTLDAVGGLDAFVDILREMGQFVFDAIPVMVGLMVDLAREALPAIRDLLSFLRDNGRAVFRGMVRATQAVSGALMGLLDALIDTTPEWTRLGSAVVNTVLPALSGFLRLVADMVSMFEQSEGFGDFLRTALEGLAQWIQGPGTAVIEGIVSTLRTTFITLLGGDEDDTLLSAFVDWLGGVLDSVDAWLRGGGKARIENLLTSMFGTMAAILDGNAEEFKNTLIDPIISILAQLFDALSSALQSGEANAFATALGTFARNLFGLLADELINYAGSDAFAADLAALGGAIMNTLGQAIVSFFARRPGEASTPAQRAAQARGESIRGRGPELQTPEDGGAFELVIRGADDFGRLVERNLEVREQDRFRTVQRGG